MIDFRLTQSQMSETNRMNTGNRKVIIELSEHDAHRILSLIQTEINESDKVWHNYWERLAKQFKQGIDQAGTHPNGRHDATTYNNR